MNATEIYAQAADAAFAKYQTVSEQLGESSEEAQIAKRQYQMAMITYNCSVAIDNEVAA